MKRIIIVCIFFIVVLFGGCGLVKVCVEKPSDIANAHKYTDQRPLTAESLKHLLQDDTAHYKVVVIYSHCCGPCQEQMRNTFSKLWNADTARVRWYFVLNDCSSLKYDNTKYLKHYGIETPYMYYLRDDDPHFCTAADDRMLNIAQYVFDRQPELEDVVNGIPCIFIVSQQGKLKTEYRRYADGKVVVGNFESLYQLIYKEIYPELVPLETPLQIQDLDFDQRDTADWSGWGNYDRKPRVCTPEGCL